MAAWSPTCICSFSSKARWAARARASSTFGSSTMTSRPCAPASATRCRHTCPPHQARPSSVSSHHPDGLATQPDSAYLYLCAHFTTPHHENPRGKCRFGVLLLFGGHQQQQGLTRTRSPRCVLSPRENPTLQPLLGTCCLPHQDVAPAPCSRRRAAPPPLPFLRWRAQRLGGAPPPPARPAPSGHAHAAPAPASGMPCSRGPAVPDQQYHTKVQHRSLAQPQGRQETQPNHSRDKKIVNAWLNKGAHLEVCLLREGALGGCPARRLHLPVQRLLVARASCCQLARQRAVLRGQQCLCLCLLCGGPLGGFAARHLYHWVQRLDVAPSGPRLWRGCNAPQVFDMQFSIRITTSPSYQAATSTMARLHAVPERPNHLSVKSAPNALRPRFSFLCPRTFAAFLLTQVDRLRCAFRVRGTHTPERAGRGAHRSNALSPVAVLCLELRLERLTVGGGALRSLATRKLDVLAQRLAVTRVLRLQPPS
eukprot:1190854-Prorocentrum_minimum.AAC.6